MFPGSFLLQSSLFSCSYFEDENTDFHPHRAPDRDSDDRDSGGDASACAELRKEQGAGNYMHISKETDFYI